ncbi:MAG: beta-ketoacyl-[Ruminococcus sp.]|nr:beta-ketoacyl-[acyl-carrier-protein] synthase family protein [Ruminococcus sp.]
MKNDNMRCVITGIGMISAIGNNAEECWNNAMASVSGIDHTRTVDTENCYSDYAAEVRNSDWDSIPGTEGMDRVTKLCIKAVTEAVSDASLGDFGGDERVSVIMGSCVGGVVSVEKYYTVGKSAELIPQMPISAIASQAAEFCHAGGIVTNVANACAAGTMSIAYASDLIRAGKADIVVAGGADAFASVPYAGFTSLHALDANPCSPFNHLSGITLGEGAGALIVESYEHAVKRGAKIYCEVLGSGISSDAHHITAPRPDGEGQMNAIRWAIENSGISEADIGYVNAHGTGTAKNDEAEFLSLHTIFDGKNDDLSVSSTKAMTGHCLGAAGAVEAVLAVKALTENTVPPTLGFDDHDLEVLAERAGKLDFCPNKPRRKELSTVMSNSFAFGGNNASIVFSKNEGNVKLPGKRPNICITGLGLVTPAGNGTEKYIQSIGAEAPAEGSLSSAVDKTDYDSLGLKMAFYRKLDRFSQLQAVSGMSALVNAGYEISDANATDIGIIVGTADGSISPVCDFEMLIAEKGNANGSAFKFPNTVYNAAGGYLSICSGIKGYNVTATNGAQSGLFSIAYAADVIRAGKARAMLATGTDENNEIIQELYSQLGLLSDSYVKPYSESGKIALSDGSVSLLLQLEEDASGKRYAYVKGCGTANCGVKFGTLAGSEPAMAAAIKNALTDAGLGIGDIGAVIGFADGHKVVDGIEKAGLAEVFGDKLADLPVISVKDTLGEARAASAALGAAHAALMISGGIDKCGCVYYKDGIVRGQVSAEGMKNILAVSYGTGGSYCAVIIGGQED